ncbi:30S ribosomal protein S6 [Candidatus Zixiibacteriota bacterium]|nr:30S ribosomal protein S6 [candidate division Zixibacteria bacterium]
MRLYETTFILSPQADEATFDRQIKAVSDVIHRYDGKVVRESRWGIRRLAYPIKRFTQGFYTRLIFEANPQVLKELERFYKIEEPYIRYMTVLFEGSLEDRYGTVEEVAAPAASAPETAPVEAAGTETEKKETGNEAKNDEEDI